MDKTGLITEFFTKHGRRYSCDFFEQSYKINVVVITQTIRYFLNVIVRVIQHSFGFGYNVSLYLSGNGIACVGFNGIVEM